MPALRTIAAVLLGLLALSAAAQVEAEIRISPSELPADAPFDEAELFVVIGGPVNLTPTAEELETLRLETAIPDAALAEAPEQPLAAYPNPTAGRSTVRFTLRDASPVRLAVYDLLGREVAVLAEGVYAEGTHTARFDGSLLAAGLYVVRLDAGGTVEAQRLTLAR